MDDGSLRRRGAANAMPAQHLDICPPGMLFFRIPRDYDSPFCCRHGFGEVDTEHADRSARDLVIEGPLRQS
jgi:hypothetical protein